MFLRDTDHLWVHHQFHLVWTQWSCLGQASSQRCTGTNCKGPYEVISPLLWPWRKLVLHHGSTTPGQESGSHFCCQMDCLQDYGKLRFHRPWALHFLPFHLLSSLMLIMNRGSWFNHHHPQAWTRKLRKKIVGWHYLVWLQTGNHIPYWPLLPDTHFKCLVILEKGKRWEIIFWDRTTEFTILYLPSSWPPSCQVKKVPIAKLGLWNRGFLEMLRWIHKQRRRAPSQVTLNKNSPMVIKLKVWKEYSGLWKMGKTRELDFMP